MSEIKMSVVMPVYNGREYLYEAIESILKQSFTDFEFIIINDCSTDNSLEIIQSFSDQRIKLINNTNNLGQGNTLNKGFDLSQGEYIARMDQDDISLPDRLKEQISFMEKNKHIGISGTWAKIIGKKEGPIIKHGSNPKRNKATLLFHTCLVHPSIIIRKNVFENNQFKFNQDYAPNDDYELWTRISKNVNISNIKKVLFFYRVHESSASIKKAKQKKENKNKIWEAQLKNIGLHASSEGMEIHNKYSKPEKYSINEFINKKEKYLKKILKANQSTNYYNQKALKHVVSKHWIDVCYSNSKYGFSPLKKIATSNLTIIKHKFSKIIIKYLYRMIENSF